MSRLSNSEKFNHPFDPYDIQMELMKEIYSCIENGCKVGIFESPTGTGKTLSLICSTMSWLRDFKRASLEGESMKTNRPKETIKVEEADMEESDDGSDDDEPDWVQRAHKDSILKRESTLARDYELHLDTIEKKKTERVQKIHTLQIKKRRVPKPMESKGDSEDEFIPDDYYSDSEYKLLDENNAVSSQVKNLLAKVNGPKETVELVNNCPSRIYFTSRTHSQLNQFAHQLKLTSFESSFMNLSERTKFLPMASRKQLCINPKVNKLKDLTSINDACMDMQKSSTSNSVCRCEFFPKLHNLESEAVVKEFIDTTFTSIHDIEDLVAIGEDLKICPYYSVRSGVPLTEIIALPYQMLLQNSSRESLKLKIDDAIIIIDEAHNLFDVISSIYSVSISEIELELIIGSLKVYLKKFAKRLNSGNRINLMKLIKLCQVLKGFMEKEKHVIPGKEILVDEIFNGTTGDSVNVHKLEIFLSKSKIAYKIEGWVQQQQQQQQDKDKDKEVKLSLSSPLLFKITSFLKSLANPSKEGKFFWDKSNSNKPSINYMLLDPSSIFKEIVNRAKCVILCGGTMEPMSDYTNYLFPYIPSSQIKMFSCNHVIPDSNLSVFPIGSAGTCCFEFSFDKRNNPTMIHNLGLTISKICETVPHGIVIFFPSYKYLDEVIENWKTTNIFTNISNQKKMFLEPKDSSEVESILSSFSKAIHTTGGALLVAVVGGKLSEGINFSDELARAVIIVGLPFPNAFSGELVAKRKYIEASIISKGGTNEMAREAAREFYENICMRAVNQSIGRSIRHINDYSILYLIDERYGNKNIQNKLSGWVKKRLKTNPNGRCMDFNNVILKSKDFFDAKVSS